MNVTERAKSPAEILRNTAKWLEDNADELVAGDGVYVTANGVHLDVTIHIRSDEFTTVSVDGHTNYIVLYRRDQKEQA